MGAQLGWVALALVSMPTLGLAEDETEQAVVNPESWPDVQWIMPVDAALQTRIDALLARMTDAEKVGQILQADIGDLSPEAVRDYNLGSVLNGGNSGPGGDDFAPPEVWLEWADRYFDASVDRSDGGVGIPVIWGSDAVHGNNNIIGATIFPHNIGLGATRNRDLIRRIGEVTARETRVSGQDWTFGPTLAVVRDDRWGRTYESYSEDPALVAEYAGAMVAGLQGEWGTETFLDDAHVVATAKHFLGDGGTVNGRDQGDNQDPEHILAAVHGAGYPPAIRAGVQSIMASFSSWRGAKLHGHRGLLTDVLKGRMQFGGFIVGDWDGHGQVRGCSKEDCVASLHAGLDLYMAPGSWQGLYASTLAHVRAGRVDRERLDDAVRRILLVKARAGLLDADRPSRRPLAGEWEWLGHPEHRAVARQAVRESLVLLKNNDQTLPLQASARLLVVGPAADSMSAQCGGWTLTWQGTGITNDLFPNGQTLLDGLRDAAAAAGGVVDYSADGSFTVPPDAAIVVFGEDPYAEFQGDVDTLDFSTPGDWHLRVMRKLRAADVPVVAVFLSGRPLWLNPELNASDALVAAWLPGSEGGGLADVLLTDGATYRHDFRGTLSFSWPQTPDHFANNGEPGERPPLFPRGYGLTYADTRQMPLLNEDAGAIGGRIDARSYFRAGALGAGWRMDLSGGGYTKTLNGAGSAPGITVRRFDRDAQEDSLHVAYDGSGAASIAWVAERTVDLTRETNGQLSLLMELGLERPAPDPLDLLIDCGASCSAALNVRRWLSGVSEWESLKIPLSCFEQRGADMSQVRAFRLRGAAPGAVRISGLTLATGLDEIIDCGTD